MTAKVREINIHNIIGYFILIPFLNPRGFYDAVPFYKPFMTAWVYLALLLIIFEMCLQYRGNLIHMEKRAEIVGSESASDSAAEEIVPGAELNDVVVSSGRLSDGAAFVSGAGANSSSVAASCQI